MATSYIYEFSPQQNIELWSILSERMPLSSLKERDQRMVELYETVKNTKGVYAAFAYLKKMIESGGALRSGSDAIEKPKKTGGLFAASMRDYGYVPREEVYPEEGDGYAGEEPAEVSGGGTLPAVEESLKKLILNTQEIQRDPGSLTVYGYLENVPLTDFQLSQIRKLPRWWDRLDDYSRIIDEGRLSKSFVIGQDPVKSAYAAIMEMEGIPSVTTQARTEKAGSIMDREDRKGHREDSKGTAKDEGQPKGNARGYGKKAAEDKARYAVTTDAAILEAVSTREKFTEYLDIMSRFSYIYSISNTALIFAQKPEATCIMDYNKWKDLGNPVRKDEEGIVIWEPDKQSQSQGGGMTYKTKKVFDVSQTHNPNYQDQKYIIRDAKSLAASIIDLSELNYQAVPERPDGVFSVYKPEEHTIEVSKGIPRYDIAAVEIIYSEAYARFLEKGETEEIASFKAKATAYLVMNHLGCRTAWDYLTVGNVPEAWKSEDDLRGLKAQLGSIQKMAKDIIEPIKELKERFLERPLSGKEKRKAMAKQHPPAREPEPSKEHPKERSKDTMSEVSIG